MKKYLLISFLSCISVLSFGQMGSIGFSLGLPQDEFKENTARPDLVVIYLLPFLFKKERLFT
ncbi:MAG: hypothetical protein ABJG47_02965 [Ekhidna sp.]